MLDIALGNVNERFIEFIMKYYGFGDFEKASMTEIAEEKNISRSRVSSIIRTAFKTIHKDKIGRKFENSLMIEEFNAFLDKYFEENDVFYPNEDEKKEASQEQKDMLSSINKWIIEHSDKETSNTYSNLRTNLYRKILYYRSATLGDVKLGDFVGMTSKELHNLARYKGI